MCVGGMGREGVFGEEVGVVLKGVWRRLVWKNIRER